MRSLSLVIAAHDPTAARALAAALSCYFPSVTVTHSLEELNSAFLSGKADVVIADLETITFDYLQNITRKVSVICTHRVPDENMWTAALGFGALDVCALTNVDEILSAVRRNLENVRSAAA